VTLQPPTVKLSECTDVLTSAAPNTSPTNSEFMRTVLAAAPGDACGWVCCFSGPPGPGARWGGKAYGVGGNAEVEIDDWNRQNSYFSVAALHEVAGEFRRRRANFSRLLALVVDDPDRNGLQGTPSYILQTSPRKIQIGIFLDADDPDCANERLVSALINRLAAMDLMAADKSGNNIVRYVRLPRGQNQKLRASGHFDHQLEMWKPDQRMSLEDAAAVFGVDLDEVKAELERQPERKELLAAGDQQVKLRGDVRAILEGSSLHDPINRVAASLVANGAHPGAVVNTLRALMESSQAPRDDRWQQRYDDIPRSVSSAEAKFSRTMQVPILALTSPEAEAKRELVVAVSELLRRPVTVNWLVKGYFEAGALSMIYGPSGCGKSFVVIDLICCIATGTPWHGRPVKKGTVFYICGEGHVGLQKRFRAWELANNISLDGAPIFVTTRAIPFLNTEAALELKNVIDAMAADHGTPQFISIDTLARNFGPGDENSAEDAGKFIQTIDELLRIPYGAHTNVVHHSGHQHSRARGSSAFRGAVDQEFEVTSNARGIELKAMKMKDAEMPASLTFKLITGIEVGEDEDGIVEGAALKLEGNVLDTVLAKAKGGDITAGDVLRKLVNEWIGVEALMASLGATNKTVQRVLKLCVDMGLLQKAGRSYEPTTTALDTLSQTGFGLAVGTRMSAAETA
jgi:hypothetical protein